MNISLSNAIFAFVLCVGAASMASAKSENIDYPDRIYVVNWTEQPSSQNILIDLTYGLSDKDGDGIYTGSFRTTSYRCPSLALQLYTGGLGNFDQDCIWGPNIDDNHSYNVYSNASTEYFLESAEENTVGFISVGNYNGGMLDVSVDWNNVINGVHSPKIKITSGDQPSFGPIPYEMYLIGNFNDFKLPVTDDNNGAFTLKRSEPTKGLLYSAEIDLPANAAEIILYSPVDVYYGLKYFHDMTLNRPSESEPCTVKHIISELESSDDVVPDGIYMKLINWKGGKIKIDFNLEYKYFVLTTMDAPVINNEDSGVEEVAQSGDIRFSNGIISVSEISDIEVYDLSGVKVISTISDRLDINNLSKGIYIVKAAGKQAKISTL